MRESTSRSLKPTTRLAAATLLLVAGACTDRPNPLEPLPPVVVPPPEAVQGFIPPVADAQERVLPTVGDAALREKLGGELSALEAALDARRAEDAARRAVAAQKLLDEYRRKPEAALDAPELSVIELVLDRARALLGLPEAK